MLKSINHPNINNIAHDPGHDGDINGFDKDIFGMVLDYHQDDYQRNFTDIDDGGVTAIDGFFEDQYNGNIRNIRWNTRGTGQTAAIPYGTTKQNPYYNQNFSGYTYNYKNWLESATTGVYRKPTENNNGLYPIFNTGFLEQEVWKVDNLTYDKNGNLLTLSRTGNEYDLPSGPSLPGTHTAEKIDDFTYNYKDGTNQLTHLTDIAPLDGTVNDLKNQSIDNYEYNRIGQLLKLSKVKVSGIRSC